MSNTYNLLEQKEDENDENLSLPVSQDETDNLLDSLPFIRNNEKNITLEDGKKVYTNYSFNPNIYNQSSHINNSNFVKNNPNKTPDDFSFNPYVHVVKDNSQFEKSNSNNNLSSDPSMQNNKNNSKDVLTGNGNFSFNPYTQINQSNHTSSQNNEEPELNNNLGESIENISEKINSDKNQPKQILNSQKNHNINNFSQSFRRVDQKIYLNEDQNVHISLNNVKNNSDSQNLIKTDVNDSLIKKQPSIIKEELSQKDIIDHNHVNKNQNNFIINQSQSGSYKNNLIPKKSSSNQDISYGEFMNNYLENVYNNNYKYDSSEKNSSQVPDIPLIHSDNFMFAKQKISNNNFHSDQIIYKDFGISFYKDVPYHQTVKKDKDDIDYKQSNNYQQYHDIKINYQSNQSKDYYPYKNQIYQNQQIESVYSNQSNNKIPQMESKIYSNQYNSNLVNNMSISDPLVLNNVNELNNDSEKKTLQNDLNNSNNNSNNPKNLSRPSLQQSLNDSRQRQSLQQSLNNSRQYSQQSLNNSRQYSQQNLHNSRQLLPQEINNNSLNSNQRSDQNLKSNFTKYENNQNQRSNQNFQTSFLKNSTQILNDSRHSLNQGTNNNILRQSLNKEENSFNNISRQSLNQDIKNSNINNSIQYKEQNERNSLINYSQGLSNQTSQKITENIIKQESDAYNKNSFKSNSIHNSFQRSSLQNSQEQNDNQNTIKAESIKNNLEYNSKKSIISNENTYNSFQNKRSDSLTKRNYGNLYHGSTGNLAETENYQSDRNKNFEELYFSEKMEKDKLRIKLQELNEKVSKYEKEKELLIDNYETIITKIDNLRNLENEYTKIEAKKEIIEEEITQLKDTISLVKEGKSEHLPKNLQTTNTTLQNLFKNPKFSTFTRNTERIRNKSVKRIRETIPSNISLADKRSSSLYNNRNRFSRSPLKQNFVLDSYFITDSVKQVTVGDEVVYKKTVYSGLDEKNTSSRGRNIYN